MPNKKQLTIKNKEIKEIIRKSQREEIKKDFFELLKRSIKPARN